MAIFISLRNYSLKNNLHLAPAILSSFAFIIHANVLCRYTFIAKITANTDKADADLERR